MTLLFGHCLDGLCDDCPGRKDSPNGELVCSHDHPHKKLLEGVQTHH